MSLDAKREALVDFFRHDFPAFCEETLKIRDEEGQLVPFKLNRMQIRHWEDDVKPVFEAWWAGTKKDPAYFIDLKARQEGDSTFWQAVCFWICSLNPLREGLVVAHLTASAAHLFSMQKRFLRHTPLKPRVKNDNRGTLHFDSKDPRFSGLDSKIRIDTADNENLGRSFTYNFVHLSEFASFQEVCDPEQTLLALYQSIPEKPFVIVVMESTAKGEGLFKELWFGKNRWKKCFISWLAADKYRMDLKKSEYFKLETVEDSLYGDETREAEAIRRELVKWYAEAEDLAWLDHETMCRLAWRRWMIENKIPSRDKNDFRQEYPTTEHDAFRAAGLGVFDQRKLADLYEFEEARQKYEPPATYRFVLNAEEIKNKGKGWWNSAWGLANHGTYEEFEEPQAGSLYVITGDPTEGLDIKADDAGASVWKLPELVEVATYDAIVNPEDFGYILYSLQQRWNRGLLIHEVNNPGHATTVILQQLGARMYWREVFDDVRKRVELRTGWKTTGTTKPILIHALRSAITEGTIRPRSLRTIKQLMQYQKKIEKTKGGVRVEQQAVYGPPPGKYAGLVIACALAVQGSKHPQAAVPQKAKIVEMGKATADWWGKFADDPDGAGVPFM